MGRKVSDGKAFNAAAPAGQVINDLDLYRIGGWNGVAIGAKDASQTDRTLAFEADPAAIYEIKVAAGNAPAVGDFMYWTTNDSTTFQRGDTHLVAAAAAANGQQPCFQVTATKNAAGYIQGRVMQSAVNKFGT
jgi:hypothetical protein